MGFAARPSYNSAVELSASQKSIVEYPSCIIKLFLVWFCSEGKWGKETPGRELISRATPKNLLRSDCLLPRGQHTDSQDAVEGPAVN